MQMVLIIVTRGFEKPSPLDSKVKRGVLKTFSNKSVYMRSKNSCNLMRNNLLQLISNAHNTLLTYHYARIADFATGLSSDYF